MPFSKSFPKATDKSVYPKWIEIYLTEEEEALVEKKGRYENKELMKECIDDATGILKDKKLKYYQSNLVQLAVALFEKRASHVVWKKEDLCKEKFDKMQKK